MLSRRRALVARRWNGTVWWSAGGSKRLSLEAERNGARVRRRPRAVVALRWNGMVCVVAGGRERLSLLGISRVAGARELLT